MIAGSADLTSCQLLAVNDAFCGFGGRGWFGHQSEEGECKTQSVVKGKHSKYFSDEPWFRTVFVHKYGTGFGWRKDFKQECLLGRYFHGPIDEFMLRFILDSFVHQGKITQQQRGEFGRAIHQLDRKKGGIDSLGQIKTFASVLHMHVDVS